MFFFQTLFESPLTYLIAFAAALFGLVLHNIVQALVASSQGDNGPRLRGFASTDPQVHLNTFYLLFLALLGFAIPNTIPLNMRNVRGRGGPEALVWLSGPLGMIAWAFVLITVSLLLPRFGLSGLGTVLAGLQAGASLCISMAVVFVFPVPPLDGAKALVAVGNQEARRFVGQLEQFMNTVPFGFMLLFIILQVTGILGAATGAVYGLITAILRLVGLL